MGSNVIHLADWAVPSYRRPRRKAATADAARLDSAWRALARQRGVQQSLAGLPASAPQPGAADTAPASRPPALRVTRLVDARQPDGGRLRISGRLIDVCAELDRLAAVEAQSVLPRRA